MGPDFLEDVSTAGFVEGVGNIEGKNRGCGIRFEMKGNCMEHFCPTRFFPNPILHWCRGLIKKVNIGSKESFCNQSPECAADTYGTTIHFFALPEIFWISLVDGDTSDSSPTGVEPRGHTVCRDIITQTVKVVFGLCCRDWCIGSRWEDKA